MNMLKLSGLASVLLLVASLANASDVNVYFNRFGDVYLEGNAAANNLEILQIYGNAYLITGKGSTRIGNGLPGKLYKSSSSKTIVVDRTLYVRTYGGDDRIEVSAATVAGEATNGRMDIEPGDGHDTVRIHGLEIPAINILEDEDSEGNDDFRISKVEASYLNVKMGMGSEDNVHVTESEVTELEVIAEGSTHFAINHNDVYNAFIWGGFEASNTANFFGNTFGYFYAYFGQESDEVNVVGNHFSGRTYNQIVMRRGNDVLWFQHNTYDMYAWILLDGGEGRDIGNIIRGLVPWGAQVEADSFERGADL